MAFALMYFHQRVVILSYLCNNCLIPEIYGNSGDTTFFHKAIIGNNTKRSAWTKL